MQPGPPASIQDVLRHLPGGVGANPGGLTDWQGEPLHMQLHHNNGRGTDNRLENISFLCPNCHAQTETWGGRNGHRRGRHADEDRDAPRGSAGPPDAEIAL